MPKQNKKQKAGETTLKGLGVALITTGVSMVSNNPQVAGVTIVSGFVSLYISIEYRNIATDLSADEIIKVIGDAAESVDEIVQQEEK